MGNPKFKKGDIVVRNNNKPTALFESIKGCDKVEIRRVDKISHVYFYMCVKTNISDNNVLFPQISFDEMYDLDVVFNRGLKIKRVYGRIKATEI